MPQEAHVSALASSCDHRQWAAVLHTSGGFPVRDEAFSEWRRDVAFRVATRLFSPASPETDKPVDLLTRRLLKTTSHSKDENTLT
ncbi:unnamed protein product [Boreogadus saida]